MGKENREQLVRAPLGEISKAFARDNMGRERREAMEMLI